MTRTQNSNPVRRYVSVRIDQLREERSKNENTEAHLVLDKSIYELSIVLDLIDRKAPLL